MLVHRGGLAQGEGSQFFCLREPAAHGHVTLDALVHVVLDAADVLVGEAGRAAGHGYVDGRHVSADVQTDGHAAHQPMERAGDHVIRCVLLHMVKAARPVDAAVHGGSGCQWLRDGVQYIAVDHVHVDDLCVAQRAGVEGLTAGGRIKRTAVQQHVKMRPVFPAGQDAAVEFGQISVVIIQSFGHVDHAPAKIDTIIASGAADCKAVSPESDCTQFVLCLCFAGNGGIMMSVPTKSGKT